MEAIYIPRLTKAPQQTEVIEVDEFLPDLETLTPVRGKIKVIHKGNYLDVSGKAEAIVTLTCHRCLQQYNHRLLVKTSEMIWLDEAAAYADDEVLEKETALEDLVESLPPNGYFYPDDWLYQQMCLAIPQRQLCDRNCQGIQLENNSIAGEEIIDSRWATLEFLKERLNNGK
ncbi:metal-binding protein [[Phormidium ambiguum] IAM M-71]|uniref:Metal-binding protein n=1 Tax=[Phormidium ambiguum] IAM M-71 TaxID=454136 RepID=A0A1U7IIY4_9CYAN|nr:YceD family protein [Phormidium ambiguum]OKH37152.1 metal-binding protein [Phormidium ambiguum IAM M-71]